ncbi:MAG: transglutaminase family protein [Sphingomonadales bacterium]|nr:transglutaminase family protein [Sphingomonadales bacterium]MBD3772510.1 transglutaminase family protein [Paracoccaceae bacterium]
MRLSIRHTTRYTFTEPVAHALQRLRLTPKHTQGQQILSWEMEYENAKEELSYEDQNHNMVTLISVEPGASEVAIHCRGEVQTQDQSGVIGRHAGHLPLWHFMGQTGLTRPGPRIRALARSLESLQERRLDFLHALSAQILEAVEYRTGQTDVGTTAEEAAAAGQGVCQDHAHIFIGAARLFEIPARYVSGYLMMNDRIEQEATHAWAEAHVDGLGWVGFDISNGICPDPRYVRVATGRDYADAAPITGITFGSTAEDLHVEIAVEQRQIDQ